MSIRDYCRKIFSPVLNKLEAGQEEYVYKASYRSILSAIGVLFCGLSAAVLWHAQGADPGYYLPVIVFGLIGILCIVVALLGNDRAVARIWKAGR